MTPSLGLMNLVMWLTELRETKFTTLLKDGIKDTYEQTDEGYIGKDLGRF